MTLEYRRPSADLIPAFERFRDAFLPGDFDMWRGLSISARTDPNAYVALLQSMAEGTAPPPLVRSDTYWVFAGDEIAGELKIRHHLRGALLRHGGHVGYSVQPKFRGKGVATAMLLWALDRLRELGETEALVTCNDSNTASARVIEKCGGVRIHDSVYDGAPHRRYMIALV
jgi:predicted acetyltransferase